MSTPTMQIKPFYPKKDRRVVLSSIWFPPSLSFARSRQNVFNWKNKSTSSGAVPIDTALRTYYTKLIEPCIVVEFLFFINFPGRYLRNKFHEWIHRPI